MYLVGPLHTVSCDPKKESRKGVCFSLNEGLPSRPGADTSLADPRPLTGVLFDIGFYDAGNLFGNCKYISLLIAAQGNL